MRRKNLKEWFSLDGHNLHLPTVRARQHQRMRALLMSQRVPQDRRLLLRRRLSETEPKNHKRETENVEGEDDDYLMEIEDDDLTEIENPMTVSKKKKRVA